MHVKDAVMRKFETINKLIIANEISEAKKLAKSTLKELEKLERQLKNTDSEYLIRNIRVQADIIRKKIFPQKVFLPLIKQNTLVGKRIYKETKKTLQKFERKNHFLDFSKITAGKDEIDVKTLLKALGNTRLNTKERNKIARKIRTVLVKLNQFKFKLDKPTDTLTKEKRVGNLKQLKSKRNKLTKNKKRKSDPFY